MRFIITAILTIFFLNTVCAQQVSLRGKVVDAQTNEPLFFANIRVLGTSFGTTTNRNGEFELRLKTGGYKLSSSFIGYYTDTIQVNASKFINNILIKLNASRLTLPEITIKPSENPAIPIIEKAILRKAERNRILNNFEFEAYTKGVIKSTEDIKAGRNSLGLSAKNDTAALMISGLLENQSQGYYQKPNKYKEIIIARKQSSNFPPSINTLTGGRLIQNFYEDNISFFGRELPGPLASNALSYYYYYIEGKTSIDNKIVNKIHIAPDNNTDPGFTGSIFISDSTYDLIKVELMLNRAANTGGLLDSISVNQQFAEYDNMIYMPSNYNIIVEANLLGLARFGFELITILYDYKINQNLNSGIFDKAIVTVLPDADKKDSLYWSSQQVIPNTPEEQIAYKRIDSLKNIPLTFWDRFSVLSNKISFNDRLSVSAPLSMYHFNRVEGNSLDLGFYIDEAFNERFSSALIFSNGFADKKLKTDFSASYLLGDYRTINLSFNVFNRVNTLFAGSEDYNNLTSTLLALISKDEFRDYYYSRGFDFDISGELFPVLSLSGGIFSRTDLSASKNTEFSFFAKERKYKVNPGIFDFNKMLGFRFGFKLDFRNYIEDGFFRRRLNENGRYFIISGEITSPVKGGSFQNKELYKFTKYEGNISSGFRTFRSASLDLRFKAIYNNGFLPYQMLYSLPGNINLASKQYTFRTLNVNEIVGENVFTLNIEHNFRDEIFKMLRIPLLKDSELQLYTYFNTAYSEIKNNNYSSTRFSASNNPPLMTESFLHPFYEAGFGIGHLLFPIQIEFSWKINYRDGNNFRVGLNSVVF